MKENSMNDIPTSILRQLPMSSLLSIVSSKKTASATKMMTNLIIAQRFRKMNTLSGRS